MDFIRCSSNGELKCWLGGPNVGGWRGPIRRNEIHAPEMRRGREKFQANALTLFRGIAEKDDAAFLLFLRKWIGENNDAVHGERLVEIHQAAMGVDDDCLAGFAKPAVVGILSRNHHAHSHEDSCTTSNLVDFRFGHGTSMLTHIGIAVNGAVAGVFPLCNECRGFSELHARFLSLCRKLRNAL